MPSALAINVSSGFGHNLQTDLLLIQIISSCVVEREFLTSPHCFRGEQREKGLLDIRLIDIGGDNTTIWVTGVVLYIRYLDNLALRLDVRAHYEPCVLQTSNDQYPESDRNEKQHTFPTQNASMTYKGCWLDEVVVSSPSVGLLVRP